MIPWSKPFHQIKDSSVLSGSLMEVIWNAEKSCVRSAAVTLAHLTVWSQQKIPQSTEYRVCYNKQNNYSLSIYFFFF